jgi:hypothetical protein
VSRGEKTRFPDRESEGEGRGKKEEGRYGNGREMAKASQRLRCLTRLCWKASARQVGDEIQKKEAESKAGGYLGAGSPNSVTNTDLPSDFE